MPRKKITDATREQRLDLAAAGAMPDDLVADDEKQRINDVLALRLKNAGVNYRDIAVKLGYASQSGAYAAVKRELGRRLQEPADSVRTIELERIDRMHQTLWKYVVGNIYDFAIVDKAIGRLISLMKRRSELLGLDAPKKIDVTTQIRTMAIEEGLDPDQAVRDAEMIIRQLDEAQG